MTNPHGTPIPDPYPVVVRTDMRAAGKTSTGLPFPGSEDPVSAGADNLRALAEALDGGRQIAQLTSNPAGSGPNIPSGAWTPYGFYAATGARRGALITVTTTSMTVTAAGLYVVLLTAEWAAASAGVRAVRVLLNGNAGVDISASQEFTSSVRPAQSASQVIGLAAGTVLTVQAFQGSGKPLAIARTVLTLYSL